MGMDSNFILINEQKLKSHFEQIADNKMLTAIEKRNWQEVIYYDNALEIHHKISGFTNVHPIAYNRIQSLTFSILISENQANFGFKKYEVGYYLEKPFCAAWLDFMLALCKRFNEHYHNETDWNLYDLEIPQNHKIVIERYLDWQQNFPPDPESRSTENFLEVAARIQDFKKMKKQLAANEFDFLLFYLSF
jgi:hypothetical protein